MTGCDIAVVTCTGESCEMKRVTYPFEPPLANSSEVRPRMVAIHKEVSAPQISWLVTDPFAFLVLVVCALLGFTVHGIGIGSLVEVIESSPTWNDFITTIFGSAATFGTSVRASWVLCVVAHNAEALFVLYHAKLTMKMGAKAQFLWYFVCACVGWPMTQKFLHLKKMQEKQKK